MKSLQSASRLDTVGFSDIVRIRNTIHALEQEGEEILQFHGGEPLWPTPEPIKRACLRALAENQTRYAPSSGIPQLLELIIHKVRAKNRIPAADGHAIVVSGGLHGLFVAFGSVLDPDDEVLVFSPYWTPVKDIIALAGGRSVLVKTFNAGAKDLAERLSDHRTERTKAIYFNSPANPTGYMFGPAEIQAIAQFAIAENLVVIADEAYEDIVFDADHLSIASLMGMFERTITVYTFSKTYSMTGWRIGYVIASDPWMQGLRKLTLNSINGVSTPTQWAAVAAMKMEEGYRDHIRQAYQCRRDLLVDGLGAAGFDCELPAGTFYAFPRVSRRWGEESWNAYSRLLQQARISTVPGVVFGPHGEGHLRFCFSTSIDTIERAVDRLRKLKLQAWK